MIALGQSQVTPDGRILRDSNTGTDRFEAARNGNIHAGSTRLERIAGGLVTEADAQWLEQRREQHWRWLDSAEGQEFLKKRNLTHPRDVIERSKQ